MVNKNCYKLSLKDLEKLFNYFRNNDHLNIGPYLKDSAVMCGHLDSFDDLPKGIYEEQAKGKYKVIKKSDESLFQYTLGPQSFKPFIFPQRHKLWSADLKDGAIKIKNEVPEKTKKVFWGIRSCDLHSIKTLDKVFFNRDFKNPVYDNLRTDIFMIAVNCGQPSDNCFCNSMNTGPKVDFGFDMALTEVISKSEHHFICETANSAAVKICKTLKFKKAQKQEIDFGEELMSKVAQSMSKEFNKANAKKILKEKSEDKHWEDVEKRCLACANCTLVCPTCFCTTTEDITELDGSHTERWQKWDSCFNGDYSYIHGGIVRKSIKSRYRQWITHKLSTWHDQFGTSGCVGCGRCITWCPVGIDIREEVKALNNSENGKA